MGLPEDLTNHLDREEAQMLTRREALVGAAAAAAELTLARDNCRSQLEACLADRDALTAQVTELQAKLAETQAALDACLAGEPVPPPPPPPGPQPPDDAIQVSPSDDLVALIAQYQATRPYWLLDGSHRCREPLPLVNAVEVGAASHAAVLQGSGPGGHPLYSGAATGVKLHGFAVQDFGPGTTDQSGAALRGGIGWAIDRLLLIRTNNTMIRLNTGWVVSTTIITDCGRYAFAGGPPENAPDDAISIIRDFTGRRLGWKPEGATLASDSNRGTNKFARTGGRGVHILGADIETARQGPWWDIANRSGRCEDVNVRDVLRCILNLEAGYFRDRFVAQRIYGRRFGQEVRDNEVNWPAPSGVQCSLTGNADLLELDIDEGRVGLGMINPASHYQLTNPKNDRRLMGVGDLVITGTIGPNIEKWSVASAGDAHVVYPEMRQPKNSIDLIGLALPAGVPTRRDW